MEVPFEIENAQMLEWIASGKGDVYIEINKEKLLPMRRILPDVYCFATILFSGETCRYRIFEGDMDVPVKTGEMVGGKADPSTEPSFYRLLQGMREAKESDPAEYDRQLQELKKRKNGAALLQPLSWEGEAK